MTELADIFGEYGVEYLEKYGNNILPSHRKAILDISLCRTDYFGGKVWFCKNCDEYHYSYHSCKNRHCPKCQNDSVEEWLKKQKDILLPVTYFMATFTLPEGLRNTARSNQKEIFNIFFRTSASAIQTLADDKKYVGGTLGMIGVLQTWSRDLIYHPHIHYLIPGCALSKDEKKLRRPKNNFLIHVKPLSIIFKAKFKQAVKDAGVYDKIPKKVWKQKWVVHIKPVGNGEAAMKYLAAYIFRVAISNNNILCIKNAKVTFRFKDSNTNEVKCYIFCKS